MESQPQQSASANPDNPTQPDALPPEPTTPTSVQRPPTRLLWTLAAALGALGVVAMVVLAVTFVRRARLNEQLGSTQGRLAAALTPDPTSAALADRIARSRRAVAELQTLQPSLAARRDWEPVYEAILNYDSAQIALTELSQDGDVVTLKGVALTQEQALAYASALTSSGVFSEVVPLSLHSVGNPFRTPVPGFTPSSTPPSGPTPTPDPSQYDAYEIDDFEPQTIFAGQVQWHSFSPVYDVDQVTFLGKAGRRYCIQAVPQAIGVDTYLEASVGGVGYVNDDCFPNQTSLVSCQCPTSTITNSAASLIELQVPAGADQQVLVRISNRAQFGPASWYTLLVTETTGDPWERDDDLPKPIGLGEVQARTFHPEGDVDQASWPIKAGHAYEVRTSNLSVGVDTVLTVLANATTYGNDDVASGDRSSRVTFEALTDGTATARVTNKGLYGPALGYSLYVQELGGDV
ncbi:MAG: hypothetical protein GX557_09790, partial [Chloroflexi bacterium]|nr:hypothetical protein [Chloroflexota bacterium]